MADDNAISATLMHVYFFDFLKQFSSKFSEQLPRAATGGAVAGNNALFAFAAEGAEGA